MKGIIFAAGPSQLSCASQFALHSRRQHECQSCARCDRAYLTASRRSRCRCRCIPCSYLWLRTATQDRETSGEEAYRSPCPHPSLDSEERKLKTEAMRQAPKRTWTRSAESSAPKVINTFIVSDKALAAYKRCVRVLCAESATTERSADRDQA